MRKVTAKNTLYIKLGRAGRWEQECIEGGTLHFGYRETPHDWCTKGQWAKVHAERLRVRGNEGVAKSDTN